MPTPPTIDIEALVRPIPGDDPAGSPPPSHTSEKFKELREEFDPADLDPNDPNRNEPRRDANWQGVIDLGIETLKDVSKSLLVAVRLVEALSMKHGMAGVRDGFVLLSRLSENCWEHSYPKIQEPDDLDSRAQIFDWLNDEKTGALYPNKLKSIPLLVSGATQITVIAWKGVPGDKLSPPTIMADQIAAAARATDPARLTEMMDNVTAAVGEVNHLGTVLSEKMGSVAPSFYKVREALEECRTLAEGIFREGGGATSAEAAAAGGLPGVGGPAGGAVTREGAYKQLEAAADLLARVEPHSPVPYLVRQAIRLKEIEFPDLVEQLSKDKSVLAFLKRDLKAKDE
jgi:type VI secretion system protein ImpA